MGSEMCIRDSFVTSSQDGICGSAGNTHTAAVHIFSICSFRRFRIQKCHSARTYSGCGCNTTTAESTDARSSELIMSRTHGVGLRAAPGPVLHSLRRLGVVEKASTTRMIEDTCILHRSTDLSATAGYPSALHLFSNTTLL